jgi:tetratricopeptide (TPR) repeat protein
MSVIKYLDWDWAGAEQEARRALALNPESLTLLSNLLTITGRHVDAIAESERAVKVDPLFSAAHYSHGTDLYFARRYQDAMAPLKRAIELEPRNWGAKIMLASTYEALGKPEQALQVYDRPEFRESPYVAQTYALLGRRDDALRVLNGLAKQGTLDVHYPMAIAYFALGDKDRGFEWLTKAFDQRSAFVYAARVEPRLDGVRDDPRYKALIARLKLPN